MKKVIAIILSISTLILAVQYSFSWLEVIFALVTILLINSYFSKIGALTDRIFSLFFILYIYCSIHVVSLFQMTSPGFFKNTISIEEYRQLAIWGNHLFLLIFAFLNIMDSMIIGKYIPNMDSYVEGKNGQKLLERYFQNATMLVIFLQLLSLAIGLAGDQYDAKVVLPFHLNGIIDEYRANVYPFIFALYLYHIKDRNGKISKKVIVIYICYALLEMFVRNSKGAFVLSFLPILVMLSFMRDFSLKKMTRYVLPLAVALVLMYPIIEQARKEGQITFQSLVSSAQSSDKIDESEKSSPYLRTFLTGIYYTKVIYYIDKDPLSFDFSNVPMLVGMSGGSAFMTRIIDGVPDTAHHSSGITGLCDVLLWGGNMMCYLFIIIFCFVATIGDKVVLMKAKPPYRLILFFFFYTMLYGRSISFFVDNLFLPSIVSIIIKIVITKWYYKKFTII